MRNLNVVLLGRLDAGSDRLRPQASRGRRGPARAPGHPHHVGDAREHPGVRGMEVGGMDVKGRESEEGK